MCAEMYLCISDVNLSFKRTLVGQRFFTLVVLLLFICKGSVGTGPVRVRSDPSVFPEGVSSVFYAEACIYTKKEKQL